MRKNVNLLILDDKYENIISLQALLSDLGGVNIVTSSDPNDALKICWQEQISIALVDVQMPGMNGFEFVSLLKSNPKTNHIIVIMVTAISKEDKYLLEGLKSGAVDYLYKPLNADITRAKVESFIHYVRLQDEVKEKNLELEESRQQLIYAKEEADHARKSKEMFLANMSHEIRTPINGIMGIIHLLKNTECGSNESEWLEMLNNASKSLLIIINDILDFSRIESGKFVVNFESFNLREFIKELESVYGHKTRQQGMTFEVKCDDDIPEYVQFDKHRLSQILTNYISNSLKFTTDGKIILKIFKIRVNGDVYQLRFEVEDTGIGIEDQHLSKIFEAFEQGDGTITKRYGGTGLGLAIVKRLALLLDGEVGAESKSGQGSKFYFEAPFKKSKFSEIEKVNTKFASLPKLENISVLIAEDNDLNAFMLSQILKTWNCNVQIVKNGQSVIDILQTENFNIILMDTHMPLMSGFEAIKIIKSSDNPIKRNIPIITISASVLENEQKEAFDVGAVDVIGKPFDPNELYHKLTNALNLS